MIVQNSSHDASIKDQLSNRWTLVHADGIYD